MSLKDAADTILQSQVKPDGSYDTLATVLRTDGDTVWVHIDGGAPETPCKKTVECKAGESVMVRISGGSAWITGNHTSPSTDDTEAEKAKEEARKAAGTATSFITDSDNGIFVHPKNSSQRGVRVTDVVDIVRDGKTVAEFGEEIRIGIANGTQSYLFEDYHSLQMVDKEGDTYFHISDLVDRNGNICEEFNGDGTTTGFNFTYTTNHIVEVLIDDVATTSYHGDSVYDIVFNNAPPNGSVITVKYTPVWDNDKVKAYTLGKRKGATGLFSYAEGFDVEASGRYTHSEGYGSIAQGFGSHAEGRKSTASGNRSHAEGNETVASGSTSHAEGNGTTASGDYSHAEGDGNTASGNYSHAEGGGSTGSTTASGNCSHAEGWNTTASDDYSHAEGGSTTASGIGSHAEGWNTEASGNYSHAQNSGTIAGYNYQSAIGRYNDNKSNNLFEIGYGSSDLSRKNVFEVDTDGNLECTNVGAAQTVQASALDLQRSGGNSTGTVRDVQKSGNMMMVSMSFAATQAYAADGSNLFTGTINTDYAPAMTTTGVGYIRNIAVVGQINHAGQVTIRPCGALNSGWEPYVYFTYFI